MSSVLCPGVDQSCCIVLYRRRRAVKGWEGNGWIEVVGVLPPLYPSANLGCSTQGESPQSFGGSLPTSTNNSRIAGYHAGYPAAFVFICLCSSACFPPPHTGVIDDRATRLGCEVRGGVGGTRSGTGCPTEELWTSIKRPPRTPSSGKYNQVLYRLLQNNQ